MADRRIDVDVEPDMVAGETVLPGQCAQAPSLYAVSFDGTSSSLIAQPRTS